RREAAESGAKSSLKRLCCSRRAKWPLRPPFGRPEGISPAFSLGRPHTPSYVRRPMNSEIQSAAEAGKRSPAAGRALENLRPGTYVQHKSWGFGQIHSINFLVSQ